MDKLSQQAYLILIARLVLSAAFLFAALPKIQDPVAFATSVDGFRVIGGQSALWIALLLPWLELVTGLGLLIPQIRQGSGLIIALLLVAFIGLHASAWMRGLDINCGCFGQSASDVPVNYLWLIVRNAALLAAAIAVFLRDYRRSCQT